MHVMSDSNGHGLGSCPRSRCHARRLVRRIVHIIGTANAEFLLQAGISVLSWCLKGKLLQNLPASGRALKALLEFLQLLLAKSCRALLSILVGFWKVSSQGLRYLARCFLRQEADD